MKDLDTQALLVLDSRIIISKEISILSYVTQIIIHKSFNQQA